MRLVFTELELEQHEHIKKIVRELNKAFRGKFCFRLSLFRSKKSGKVLYKLFCYTMSVEVKGYKFNKILNHVKTAPYSEMVKAIQDNLNEYIKLVKQYRKHRDFNLYVKYGVKGRDYEIKQITR